MAHPTLVFSPAHNEFSDNVPPYTCVCLTTCIWHFRVVFPIMVGKIIMCGFQNLFTYRLMTHLWQLYFFFMLVKREKRDGKYPSTGGGPAEAVYRGGSHYPVKTRCEYYGYFFFIFKISIKSSYTHVPLWCQLWEAYTHLGQTFMGTFAIP